MRAKEFVSEARKIAKISKRNDQATRGLHKFRDPSAADRFYELNRIMMAAASTDGTFVPELNAESWSGRYNTAHPYTKEEQDKLKMAFKSMGTDNEDLNGGNMESMELDSTNKKSPVSGLKFKFK